MTSFAKLLGIFLLIGGLFIWAVQKLPSIPMFSVSTHPKALIASPLPAYQDGFATLEGTVIYDGSARPVPYIEYQLQDGSIRTKQLMFHSNGDCATGAGDLPCALQTKGPAALAPDSRVRVRGTIISEQIIVDSIESI